jgi:hypothetical protein
LPSESVHVSDEKAESALKNAEKEAIEHGVSFFILPPKLF